MLGQNQSRGEVAEWGDATVCKAVHVGSIPTFASTPFPEGLAPVAELSRARPILQIRSEGLARSPSDAPIARRVRRIPHRTNSSPCLREWPRPCFQVTPRF